MTISESKKIKIAFLMPHFIMGGAETCLLRLITGLKKLTEYEISVITQKPVTDSFFLSYFKENHVPLIHFSFETPSVPKERNFITRTVARLNRSLAKKNIKKESTRLLNQFDILVDYLNCFFLNHIKDLKVKKIGWLHFNREIYDRFSPQYQENILTNYNKVVCLTQSFYQFLINKDHRFKDKLVQIYNHIDPSDIKAKATAIPPPIILKIISSSLPESMLNKKII